MAPSPSAAQRRIIEAADPVTGRLAGTAAQLAGLVRLRLAFRHPRPPHDHFLTPEGRRLRETGARPEPERAPEPAASVFTARAGGEPTGDDGPERARQVRSAWQGLIEMRRLTRSDGATDRPCAWERSHLVAAAALALEAAGCRPATADRAGYRVTSTAQPEAVAVHAPTAGELRACAEALERAGWQPGEHTERGTRERYVLASPRRM